MYQSRHQGLRIHVYGSPPPVPVLNQINPVRHLLPGFKIYFNIYPPIYAQVCKVVNFHDVSPPKPFVHLPLTACATWHTNHILRDFNLVGSTDHQVRYGIFCGIPLRPPYLATISSSAQYLQSHPTYVHPLNMTCTFHTHVTLYF